MEAGNEVILTVEERERITLAVQRAEQQTRAEIVPMIVPRSGFYRDAQHWAGLVGALTILTLLLTCETLWLPWGWHAANAAWLVCATIFAYGIGSRVGTLGPVIHLFTPRERMQHKVRLRAEQGFARHAISKTRERTGVLILLSVLERQIYVLPDHPLAQQVPVERWSQIVQVAVERLKAQDMVGGLCEGIEHCGRLLAEVCPARPGDNPDELPNQPVQER